MIVSPVSYQYNGYNYLITEILEVCSSKPFSLLCQFVDVKIFVYRHPRCVDFKNSLTTLNKKVFAFTFSIHLVHVTREI